MCLLCLLSQSQLYMHHTDRQDCQDSRGNKTDIIYACACVPLSDYSNITITQGIIIMCT